MTARLRGAEAAQLAGVSPSTLRAWESSGLIKPSRTGRYRWFSPGDVKDLQEIASPRARGFNVAAIRSMLHAGDRASGRPAGGPAQPGTGAEPEQSLGAQLLEPHMYPVEPGGGSRAPTTTTARRPSTSSRARWSSG
jgi:DNA-binding transcriptional MerR regulator